MTKEELRKLMFEALHLLNSVELQNELADSFPQYQGDFMQERRAMGEVDELPNAQGEFGRTPTNPILVNETWGEITYLSRLLTADNQRMIFHRAGSVAGAIDAFELVSVDGKFFDVLYVDMYHRHCSKKAPTGYSLLEIVDGITGTSENNPAFPARVEDTLIETAINMFGAPIVSPSVFKFDAKQAAKLIDTARRGDNLSGKILSKMTI